MSYDHEEKSDNHGPRPSQTLFLKGFEKGIHHLHLSNLPANMKQERYDRGSQPAARKKESRLAERRIEPRPSNPISFASPFFFEQPGQHFALFQGAHTAHCLL
jgi:hypothetical protein